MKEYKDKCLMSNDWILGVVQSENARQLAKWGQQTHTLFEWLAYTTEELGELAEAVAENEYRGGSLNDIVAEAVQVATLALKIAEMTKVEIREV
jgi:NTP pyrophosphatase (non-canonical NTP hydrolase)